MLTSGRLGSPEGKDALPAPSLGLIPVEAEVPSFSALPLLPSHWPSWGPLTAMSLCSYLQVDLHVPVTTGKVPRETKDAPAHDFGQQFHFWAEKPQTYKSSLPSLALSKLPLFLPRNILTPFRQKSQLGAEKLAPAQQPLEAVGEFLELPSSACMFRAERMVLSCFLHRRVNSTYKGLFNNPHPPALGHRGP